MANQIDISVDASLRFDSGEGLLRAAVEAALGVALAKGEACQVSLVVTGDETVRSLNRDFRGLDEVTDVLSFSATHSGQWEGDAGSPEGRLDTSENGCPSPFVYPPNEPDPLGEVVLSYPQAQRQATERDVPVDQELAALIVHGVLHLVGHDHLESQERAGMQDKERAALQSIPPVATPQARTLNK